MCMHTHTHLQKSTLWKILARSGGYHLDLLGYMGGKTKYFIDLFSWINCVWSLVTIKIWLPKDHILLQIYAFATVIPSQVFHYMRPSGWQVLAHSTFNSLRNSSSNSIQNMTTFLPSPRYPLIWGPCFHPPPQHLISNQLTVWFLKKIR